MNNLTIELSRLPIRDPCLGPCPNLCIKSGSARALVVEYVPIQRTAGMRVGEGTAAQQIPHRRVWQAGSPGQCLQVGGQYTDGI